MSEFDWIKDRFDRVDTDNAAIKEDLSSVKARVERHGVYWEFVKWGTALGIPGLLSYLGLRKHE